MIVPISQVRKSLPKFPKLGPGGSRIQINSLASGTPSFTSGAQIPTMARMQRACNLSTVSLFLMIPNPQPEGYMKLQSLKGP